MKKILLIDDEQRMLDLLSLYISPYGYECIKKTSAEEGIEILENQHISLIILDIMMPNMDGFAACEKIRTFSNVPIIMLTAKNDQDDTVKGLKKGADDYIFKPFHENELLARIEAVLRRVGDKVAEDGLIKFKGLLLNESTYEMTYQNTPLPLTPKEFALLHLFLSYPNNVFSRNHLLSSIWGYQAETEDRTIDSHIRNVREKLRSVHFPVDEHLQTVWGMGYKWNDKI